MPYCLALVILRLLEECDSAVINLAPIGLKQPLVTSQSQAGKLDTLFQHASVDKLSQYAVTQSQAREARHAISACIV